jgi:hypothetical protein
VHSIVIPAMENLRIVELEWFKRKEWYIWHIG